MDELIAGIMEECANFSAEELQSAILHLLLRLHLVHENVGGLIEHSLAVIFVVKL